MQSIAARLRALKNATYRETEILTIPDGTRLVLSTMANSEDRHVADYIQEHLGKAIGHYSKLETLAQVIRWIHPAGDPEPIDLRGVEVIPTGEVLPNGTPISVKRTALVKEIIDTWTDAVVDRLYLRYAKLVEDVEADLNTGVKVELDDSALIVKIQTAATELERLVLDARARGLKPTEVFDFRLDKEGSEEISKDQAQALAQLLRTPVQKLGSQFTEEPAQSLQEEIPAPIRR